MPNSGFIWTGNSGCLLPFLIIFNLFFGKLIFNSTRIWLSIEFVLILIFILKIRIMVNKIKQQFGQQGGSFVSNSQTHRPAAKVIDVQGDVIEEDKKLK
ncbi:MAG: hypothetical protein PHC29_05175 [Candidatus Omnitrophica bacterium]|nr:hypothetical protein [Candidatus Omnitrophota bacterium]